MPTAEIISVTTAAATAEAAEAEAKDEAPPAKAKTKNRKDTTKKEPKTKEIRHVLLAKPTDKTEKVPASETEKAPAAPDATKAAVKEEGSSTPSPEDADTTTSPPQAPAASAGPAEKTLAASEVSSKNVIVAAAMQQGKAPPKPQPEAVAAEAKEGPPRSTAKSPAEKAAAAAQNAVTCSKSGKAAGKTAAANGTKTNTTPAPAPKATEDATPPPAAAEDAPPARKRKIDGAYVPRPGGIILARKTLKPGEDYASSYPALFRRYDKRLAKRAPYPPRRPPRPYSEWMIYYNLEKNYLLEKVYDCPVGWVRRFDARDPEYPGPPLPRRYQRIVLPAKWYTNYKNLLRKERDFDGNAIVTRGQLSDRAEENWKKADNETREYVKIMHAIEMKEFKRLQLDFKRYQIDERRKNGEVIDSDEEMEGSDKERGADADAKKAVDPKAKGAILQEQKPTKRAATGEASCEGETEGPPAKKPAANEQRRKDDAPGVLAQTPPPFVLPEPYARVLAQQILRCVPDGVLSYKVIATIAHRVPATLEGLVLCGVGREAAARYGAKILSACRAVVTYASVKMRPQQGPLAVDPSRMPNGGPAGTPMQNGGPAGTLSRMPNGNNPAAAPSRMPNGAPGLQINPPTNTGNLAASINGLANAYHINAGNTTTNNAMAQNATDMDPRTVQAVAIMKSSADPQVRARLLRGLMKSNDNIDQMVQTMAKKNAMDAGADNTGPIANAMPTSNTMESKMDIENASRKRMLQKDKADSGTDGMDAIVKAVILKERMENGDGSNSIISPSDRETSAMHQNQNSAMESYNKESSRVTDSFVRTMMERNGHQQENAISTTVEGGSSMTDRVNNGEKGQQKPPFRGAETGSNSGESPGDATKRVQLETSLTDEEVRMLIERGARTIAQEAAKALREGCSHPNPAEAKAAMVFLEEQVSKRKAREVAEARRLIEEQAKRRIEEQVKRRVEEQASKRLAREEAEANREGTSDDPEPDAKKSTIASFDPVSNGEKGGGPLPAPSPGKLSHTDIATVAAAATAAGLRLFPPTNGSDADSKEAASVRQGGSGDEKDQSKDAEEEPTPGPPATGSDVGEGKIPYPLPLCGSMPPEAPSPSLQRAMMTEANRLQESMRPAPSPTNGEDEISVFLRQVEQELGPTIAKELEEILRKFVTGEVGIAEVTGFADFLFREHPDLMIGFNKFLDCGQSSPYRPPMAMRPTAASFHAYDYATMASNFSREDTEFRLQQQRHHAMQNRFGDPHFNRAPDVDEVKEEIKDFLHLLLGVNIEKVRAVKTLLRE